VWAVAEPPHILVGNLEQIHKLVVTGKIRLNAVSFVVVDEVDCCLNNDQRPVRILLLLLMMMK
jgi:Lhr-like helicase